MRGFGGYEDPGSTLCQWTRTIATLTGFVYVAIVIPAPDRRLGVSGSCRTDLALDRLSRCFTSGDLRWAVRWSSGSSRGTQYSSIRYADRFTGAGIEPSIGSRADSHDNLIAEAITGFARRIDFPVRGVSMTSSSPRMGSPVPHERPPRAIRRYTIAGVRGELPSREKVAANDGPERHRSPENSGWFSPTSHRCSDWLRASQSPMVEVCRAARSHRASRSRNSSEATCVRGN